MRAWGRLLRLSLAPTAAADIAAGVALGAGLGGGLGEGLGYRSFLPLVLASLCVYHGGMALNDWADRAEDARIRPDRPIPSGAVRPGAALALAVALLVAGPCVASIASPVSATILAGVSVAAAVYDLCGRGPFRGPLLLGICRAGNLASGIALAAGTRTPAWAFLPAGLYGLYVFSVSRLARLEDAGAETLERGRPGARLVAAAVILAAAPAAVLVAAPETDPLRTGGAFLLSACGALGLVQAARRTSPWTYADVMRATGLGLRRLLVFTAALALAGTASAGPIVAAAILLGYPIAYALRGVFPPS